MKIKQPKVRKNIYERSLVGGKIFAVIFTILFGGVGGFLIASMLLKMGI